MKKILLLASVALVGLASLMVWGSAFSTGFVRDQLGAQKISFPAKEALEADNPALVKYAGQQVDSAEEAKAYSDYIAGHLKKIGGGKTYSEVSAEYQADKTNTALAAQRESLFMGEMLRGTLLNAWGWGLVGSIAMYGAVALYAVAVVLAAWALFYSAKPKKNKR